MMAKLDPVIALRDSSTASASSVAVSGTNDRFDDRLNIAMVDQVASQM